MQKNRKILVPNSEAIFEKVQFWAKFEHLTPPTGGQEFFFEKQKVLLFYIYAVLTLHKISKTSGWTKLNLQDPFG